MILFIIALVLAIPTYGISVLVYIGIIFIKSVLIKGKREHERIRESLYDLRMQARRDPLFFIQDFTSVEYTKYKNISEIELKTIISHLLISALRVNDCKIEYIKGNIELTNMFAETVNEMYKFIDDALNEEDDNLDFLDEMTDEEFKEKFKKRELPFQDLDDDTVDVSDELNRAESISHSVEYYQEVKEVIRELFALRQDEEIQKEILMNHFTGSPVSTKAKKVDLLMNKLSNLTGKSLEELFGGNGEGLKEVINEIQENTSNEQDKQNLLNVVNKTSNLPEGIFANINNDLNNSIREDHPPIVKMAYAYARRTAAAGLFLQGVFSRDNYTQASKVFRAMQIQTGHTVEFQEEAAQQAYELLHSYDNRITKNMTSFITTMVEHNQTPEQYNGKTHLPYELIMSNIQNALNKNDNKQEISQLFKRLHRLLEQDEEVENAFYHHYLSGKDYNASYGNSVTPLSILTETKTIMYRLSTLTGKTPEQVFRDNFDGTKKPVDDID